MKHIQIALFVTFLCAFSANSQVLFSYDNGGNLIQRSIQIINPNREVNPHNSDKIKDSTLVFKIYPNPTNEFINIEGRLEAGNNTSDVFLRNSVGMLVKKEVYDGTFKCISVSDLMAGVYFIEIKYGKKKSSNYKIIITN